MNWKPLAVLVCALVVAPQAQAEGPFAGITYGQLSSDEADTGNLGVTVGYYSEAGFGFEAFYLKAVSDDSTSISGIQGDASVDTWGIFGVYKSADDIYFKGKVGFGVVSAEFDVDGGDTVKDSESGLGFGLAVGTTLGPGDIELSYTMLPSLGDYDDIDVNADTDIIAISYLWYI